MALFHQFHSIHDLIYFATFLWSKRLLQVLYHVSPKTLWTIVDVKIYYVIRNVFKIYATSIFIAISSNKMNLILIHTARFFKECRKAFLFIVCSINLKKNVILFDLCTIMNSTLKYLTFSFSIISLS